MYHASLDVQLPAQLPPPSELVRGMVERMLPSPVESGADDPDAELREALRDNLSVFEVLVRAFEAAGFDDVVAILVDGKAAYLDTEECMDDLGLALEGLVESGSVADGYAVMRTTFWRREGGLELLGELRCHARSNERRDETRIRLSARPVNYAPTEDEDPREYASRVRGALEDSAKLDAERLALEGIRDRLAREVSERLPSARLETGPAVIRLISLGPRQVGRLRHLGFGALSRTTAVCSLPSYERVGPYDDPLSRHYYSPYNDLFHWIAVGEALQGKLASAHVEVVSATGRRLFRGSEAARFDPARLAVARDVVRVTPEGRLKIDGSVPEVAALELAERGSPHSRGWGGEAWAEDIDEG